MTPDEIEQKIVEAFIASDRKPRSPEGFGRGKRRAKTLDRLNHCVQDFDARYISEIPGAQQNSGAIEALLKAKGAPEECYVVSSGRLDGRFTDLRDALEEVVGSGFGTVVSCVHGKLAYYESEEMGGRFLLERSGR